MKNLMKQFFALFAVLVLASHASIFAADASRPKPNIILILTDDLGYGDLGCYGSGINETPNIDALANGGLRFTDYHTAGAMCSPTRASILTGRYAQRFGQMFDGALSGTTQRELGLPLEATTIAEVLNEKGYATGCFGKWHLGYQAPLLPTRQGFDVFRGLVSGDGDFHTHIDRSGNEDWWHNEELVNEKGYTTDLLTRHSIDFIESHRDEPFFLYLPHLAIHFPWQGPDDPPHRTTGKSWHQDKWGVIPDRGKVMPHVKAMIESLDSSVGAIVAALRKWELENDTLVIFTSDNGGYRTYGKDFRNISSNGSWRGQKTELYEGGHRVPMIFSWPGRIPSGVTDETVHSNDLFPTLLSLSGSKLIDSDGVDLVPVWTENERLPTRDLFWRTRTHGAVRRGPWKLIVPQRDGAEPELYHLGNDPGETTSLTATESGRVQALNAAWVSWNVQMETSEERSDHPAMLVGDWLPEDPHQIDYNKLPRVPASHAIISDVRDHAGTRVHQHAYLAHHDGRFWAMWSDGPGLPKAGATAEQHRNIVPGHDRAGTRNSFATSLDGLNWTRPGDLTGPPRIKGYGWIARGLWKRDGELLALASHFNAPGYAGPGLSLEAFRWNGTQWEAHGTVLDDSMNNFPPKRLPSGEWMMTRRDHRRQVSVMIGGTNAFDDWHIHPLAAYDGNGRPEEPYWYILPDDSTIVGLIRDNGGSRFLLRTFSRDNGRTWSKIHRTNFPDATSKFFVHRTSRGYYVMVSNSNPRGRDPLTLAISQDGVVFDRLFRLIGGRHVDYPHIIEHDGHLLIAFSGAKQTMEVMKVSLDELERLAMPDSVELARHLPPVKKTPQQPPAHWIDLGDEGTTLYAVADLVVPESGQRAAFSLTTASGAERVVIGIDENGRLAAQLYGETVTGLKLEPGSRHSILVRLHSHREKRDELSVELGPSGQIPAEPENWTVSNTKGSSAANLSRAVVRGDVADCAGFRNVRVATTREGLSVANVVAE